MKQLAFLAALLVAAAAGLGQSGSASPASRPQADTAPAGDPAAGKKIFNDSGKCLSCHRVGASGSVLAPNLTDAGARLSAEALEQVLLDPPAGVPPQDRLYQVMTRGGKAIRGKLLNQDPFSVQLLDSEGRLIALSRSEIQDARWVDPPQMPSYRGKLTNTQLRDLVAYLESLRVPTNP